jgi:hypothetical protein
LPVAQLYRVAVVLTNCIMIVRRGNTNSAYFKMSPPTLDEYFASLDE